MTLAPVNPNKPARSSIALFVLLLVVLLAALSLVVWWAYLDPIAPNIVNEEATITDLTPDVAPGQRGVFEVVRVITSDRSAPCTIFSFFERPNPEMREHGGRPVIADPTTFAIANAATTVEKGRHRRDRLWEVPGSLPPGQYIYKSAMRFCNPLRCTDVWFDNLPVSFRMGGTEAP